MGFIKRPALLSGGVIYFLFGFLIMETNFIMGESFPPEAEFARYPAISPDGERVAFSYGGDIWVALSTGGEAIRLTHHPAYAHHPRWSPDGEYIAFSEDRWGNDDVYIIPSRGGPAQRLTFHEADDIVCDWSPDGEWIYFSSARGEFYPDFNLLYQVHRRGGTPRLVMAVFGYEASISPDGEQILFTRGDSQWWRRGYRSSGNAQVWWGNLKNGDIKAVSDTLPHTKKQDFLNPSTRWGLWGENNSIIVATERNGTYNLWKKGPNEDWIPLTHYTEDGIRFPAASYGGRWIVFEQGRGIWKLDLYDGQVQLIPIKIAWEGLEQEPHKQIKEEGANNVILSRDERFIGIEIGGEIFWGKLWDEEVSGVVKRFRSLSGDSPARDQIGDIAPDGDTLLVVSDRLGNKDIFLVSSSHSDPLPKRLDSAFSFQWEPLITSPEEEHSPRFSPDGKYIAFIQGLGDLMVRERVSGKQWKVVEGWSLEGYAWSPDSRWIAYAKKDDEYNTDIWIVSFDGKLRVNVSRHPDDDEYPVWSPDGSKLAFRSRRRENNWDIYFVFLRLADEQKSLAQWKEEEWHSKEFGDEGSAKRRTSGESHRKTASELLTIDTTDIYRRVRSVTSLPGTEGIFDISPDGKKFVFTSSHEFRQGWEWRDEDQINTDIYLIDWDGKNVKRLTTGAEKPKWIKFDREGKKVFYLDRNGRIKSVNLDGSNRKTYPFDVRYRYDESSLRTQKFHELWRVLRDQFYDPQFHNRNWDSLKVKYLPWMEIIRSEKDFGDVVKMMFGELNASHMGYFSPPPINKVVTGHLGLDFAPHPLYKLGSIKVSPPPNNEGLRIAHILPRGPCDRVGTEIRVGEWLTGIDGKMITPAVNLHSLLEDKVDVPVELTIWDGKRERGVVVRPCGEWEESLLRYDEWVQGRRRIVDSLTQGRLGYLHIRGMGEMSLARFEAELFSAGMGKEGLVVDVRYNTGGWTTDYILTMLQVRRHATTFPRGGGPGYPQSRLPYYVWFKPIIVLCNEHSFSNAEIFCHAIQNLGRAQLVGVPTPGGVISTDSYQLLDGSRIRVPLRGWYKGEIKERDPQKCMEGNGAVPEILVTSMPGEMERGEDRQLITAVEKLLSDLAVGKEPSVPK